MAKSFVDIHPEQKTFDSYTWPILPQLLLPLVKLCDFYIFLVVKLILKHDLLCVCVTKPAVLFGDAKSINRFMTYCATQEVANSSACTD